MSDGDPKKRSSPVIKLEESWTEMGLRLMGELNSYLTGPGPRKALHTYRWILAGILATLLVATGHWTYWVLQTEPIEEPTDSRTITEEGFAVNQRYAGYRDGETISIRGRIDEVTVVENFSYTQPKSKYGGVRVVNIVDPSAPFQQGLGFNTKGDALDIAITGELQSMAYSWDRAVLVADGRKRPGLRFLDASDLTDLKEVGDGYDNLPGNTTAVAIDGQMAALGDNTGVVFVDFSRPLQPVRYGQRFNLTEPVLDIELAGDLAYLATGGNGLTLLNISSLKDLQLMSVLDTPGNVVDVTVVDGFAYVADSLGGLRIVNVTSATDPEVVAVIETPGGSVYQSVIANRTAYLAAGPAGLLVYDLTNISSPRHLGTLATGNVTGLAVAGDVAYLAAGENGLLTVDLSDLLQPVRMGQVKTNGATVKVILDGDRAFVTDVDLSYHFSFISEYGFPFDFNTENHTLITIDDFTFIHAGNLSTTYYENELIVVDLVYRKNASSVITGYVGVPYNQSFDNLTLTYGYFEATDISLSWDVDHLFFWLEGLFLVAGIILTVATSPRVRQELRGASKIARFEVKSKFSSPVRTMIIIIMLAFFVVGTAWGVAGQVGVSKPGDSFYVADANEAIIMVTHFTFFILSLFTLVSAFNVIVQERLGNTLNMLLCRPLNRAGILLGKLAGLQVFIGLPALISTLLAVWIINNQAGEWPALGASIGYIIFTQVMIFTFLVLQANISVNSRNPTTAAFMGIGVWVTFALLWSRFRLALAYASGLDVGSEDLENSAEFQALAGWMALLNPGEVYDFTIALMLPRGVNDNIEGIPRWAPPVAMLIWASGLLWLAMWRFSREQRG